MNSKFICVCGKEFDNVFSFGGHTGSCEKAKKEKQLKKANEELTYEFACDCGKKFKTLKSLNSHARFCDKYQKKKNITKYKNIRSTLYTCECGYETEKSLSLNGHFSHCLIHRQANGKDCSAEYWNKRNPSPGKMQGWDKFSNEQLKNIRVKSQNTLSEKIKTGECVPAFKGKHHTDETKNILSIKRHHNLENGIGNHWICPAINRSYAELYFYDCFKNCGIDIKNNVWVNHYCLDFVYDNMYFEVDGEQHYTKKAIEKDNNRKLFLETKGYFLIDRCRWKNFIKLSLIEKEQYVKNIINSFKTKCVNKNIT